MPPSFSILEDSVEPEREEAIRLRAFRIWQSAGSPEGRDLEFRARAERELQADEAELPTEAEIASDDEAQKPREARRGMT